MCAVLLVIVIFFKHVPGEVFLTCQQFLEEQDARGLKEVWLSQRMQTLLDELQDFANTNSLSFVQRQRLQDTIEEKNQNKTCLKAGWHNS